MSVAYLLELLDDVGVVDPLFEDVGPPERDVEWVPEVVGDDACKPVELFVLAL